MKKVCITKKPLFILVIVFVLTLITTICLFTTNMFGATNEITYNIQNDWGTGSNIMITIENTGDSAINDWTLKWTFPEDQKIITMWNGDFTQDGATVTVKNIKWNKSIAPNDSINFGFNMTYTGKNSKPSDFSLDVNDTATTGNSIAATSSSPITSPAKSSASNSLTSSIFSTLIPTITPSATASSATDISETASSETFSKVSEFPDWDKVHTGYATYTGSGYTGGTALLDPIPSDMEITALNNEDYYKSYGVEAALAGAYLEVSGAKGKTVVFVCDLYPEGGPGALDLCPTSFNKLDDKEKGKIDISWRIIPAPISGDVSYRIKEGSTQSWLALQVRDHKYPVLKMEYYNNGEWINMKKMFWNHFMAENLPATTIKIRMTDIRGYVITDTVSDIPETGKTREAYIIPGNVQFPD